MGSNRKDFLKFAGMAGVSLAGGSILPAYASSLKGRKNEEIEEHQKGGFAETPQLFQMSDQMKNDYELALNILKPTKKQLEHGLELHRQSLVIDTYGFMPRAAVDGEAIATAINDSASPLEIQDMRENMSMTRFVDNERERKELENAWNAAGVTCIFQNAGEESNSIKRLLKRLAHFSYVTDMMQDIVGKIVNPEDIVRRKKKGKHSLFLSGNGVPMPQDWISLEEELRYIKIFYQLGIRMMHLTYNRRNMIGDGCGESSNCGLSDFGQAVVKKMNEVGVIIDIAHSSWQTSLEAVQISDQPVVASHSTSASVYEHIRSKPDDVIKAIADTNGYIGICCIPRFLGGNGNILDMMKHINYVVKNFGADYVGIGTDVAYTSKYAPKENKKIPEYRRRRTRWEALWPSDDFNTKNEMVQSMAWTNWPLFTVGLVQMGYSDSDIKKIIGGNALRVARAVA